MTEAGLAADRPELQPMTDAAQGEGDAFKRPAGVVILAVGAGFSGAADVILGVWSLLDGVAPMSEAFLGLITGSIDLVLGAGLWQLKEWARAWTLLFAGVGALIGVLSLCALASSNDVTAGPLFYPVRCLIVLGYLSQSTIKDIFR